MDEPHKMFPAGIVFVVVVLAFVALVIYMMRQGGVDPWSEAANAPAEQPGLSGVSAGEQGNFRAARYAPSQEAVTSSDMFETAANALAQ